LATPIQLNFTRGELSPFLHARIDLDHYKAGLAWMRNWVPLRYGGMTRAPGSLFYGATKTSAKLSRFIPFQFNRAQRYAIEVGETYFRFWVPGGRIESPPGTPVEVVTPYLEADLKYIQTRQSGDLVYITCRGYWPRVLTRNSETSWSLDLYVPIDGPYGDVNTTSTTLTPASTGGITPDMTSNTLPSGTAANSVAGANAYQAFDRDVTAGTVLSATISGWLSYDFAGTTTKVADAYWLAASRDQFQNMPTTWTFEGYNGSSWVVLDVRIGEVAWGPAERRYFEFPNQTAYQSYRINWTAVDGGTDTTIDEMVIHESGDTQTAFNLTASSITGINDNTGFQTTDVGRTIRLFGPDGIWRWARIVSRTSTTVVTVRLYGHALLDLSPITNWAMDAFSVLTGYPAVVGQYEERLLLARTSTEPTTIWGTVAQDTGFDDFSVSSPVVADDAFTARLTGGLSAIQWLADGPDIIVGTEGALKVLGRNDPNAAFGPLNLRQKPQSEIPTSYVPGFFIENVLVFLSDYRTQLYEALYTNEAQGYSASEISALNEHLLGLGVTSVAYQKSPHKIIWMTTDNGLLLAVSYDRGQEIFGVSQCDLGGDAVAEWAMTLPGETVDGDDVWLIVRRTQGGVAVRNVEKLSAFYREGYSAQEFPVYAHCAGYYQGAATSTVTGLGDYEGDTLGVWADGVDLGDVTVQSGNLLLPNDIEAATVVFGYRFSSRAVTLRPADYGSGEPGLGKPMISSQAILDLYQTPFLRAGAGDKTVADYDNGLDVMRRDDWTEVDPFAAVVLEEYTGAVPMNLDGGWSDGGVCTIETNSMHPATVRAVLTYLEGEDP
jgi:hypothetical protein